MTKKEQDKMFTLKNLIRRLDCETRDFEDQAPHNTILAIKEVLEEMGQKL